MADLDFLLYGLFSFWYAFRITCCSLALILVHLIAALLGLRTGPKPRVQARSTCNTWWVAMLGDSSATASN